MKKVLTLILLTLPLLSFCQDESGFGFRIGIASNNIKFKQINANKKGQRVLSPTIGIIGHSIITEKFRLYSEASYNSINTNFTDTSTVIESDNFYNDVPVLKTGTDSIRLINIQWILMPEYKFIPNAFLKGGIVINYSLSGRLKGRDALSSLDASTKAGKILMNDNSFLSFGLGVGAGFSYRNLRLDFQYIQGLTNLFTKDGLEEMEETVLQRATHNSFQVALGYIIGKKRKY